MDAYEIRLQLLKLALDIENDKNNAVREKLQYDWNVKHDLWLEDHKSEEPVYPELPHAKWENVISVAEELNKFVSKK